MRKFACLALVCVVMLVAASEAKAFGLGLGFGLFGGLRRQNVVVNNFNTGLGGQAAFIQRSPFVQQAVFADPCVGVGQAAFIQRSAFVPSSTVVIGGGVQRIGVGGLHGGVNVNRGIGVGGQQRVIIRR